MKKDYYEILGVSKNATDEEIKKAFRKKAMEYHPDKNNGDDTKFKEINEAYSVLSDKQKRQNYDNFGSADMGGAGFSGQGFDFGGFDFSQAQGFGGQGFEFDLGDIFGDFFGRSSARRKRQVRGSDIEVNLEISFKESILGTKKTFKIQREKKCEACSGSGAENGKMKTCDKCHGQGFISHNQQTPFGTIQRQVVCNLCGGEGKIPEKKCSICGGNGIVSEMDEIKVSIPAGVEDGQTLRLVGKGNDVKDGISGDLYINLIVKNNTNFEKRENDLFVKKEIPFSTVVLGGKVEIEGIEKKYTIKIPAGTQSGTKFKIKGAGVKDKGDLFVEVQIAVPEKPSREYKKIVEELKKIEG